MSDCRETLPRYYDKNIIGFFPQCPDTLFVYWELSLSHWETVAGMGGAFVRLYSVRENGDSDFEYILAGEVQPPPYTGNWYFTGLQPGAVYIAEIGVKLPDGNFYSMVKSEMVLTPPLPRYDITPRGKPAAGISLETPTVNREDKSFQKNELKIGLDEVFQEMPFYMGYDIQLAD
ncbi:MAG: DUF4912 domain-containing protein [Bacillota bacterium]